MRIERIRAQIERGKITEQQTGVLQHAVVNLARLNDVIVSRPELEKAIDFVNEDIEHAPALMMIIEEAAAANGAQPDIQPILDATENYFLAPDDIIPDRYGLVGLLDDAYLIHSLMEVISDRFKSQTGKSLLPFEAHEMNTFIRRLIGEPFVGLLDARVSTTLDSLGGDREIDRMLAVLAQMELSSAPDPIWGNTPVAEIAGARIDAIAGF